MGWENKTYIVFFWWLSGWASIIYICPFPFMVQTFQAGFWFLVAIYVQEASYTMEKSIITTCCYKVINCPH